MSRASTLVAFAGMLSFAAAAHAQWWWPPTDGWRVVPECPSPTSLIEVTLAGEWPHSCVPNVIDFTRAGNVIDITTERIPPPGFCLQVITRWSQRVEIGALPAGEYEVWATHLLEGRPELPRVLLGTIRVDLSCGGCYADCDTSTGIGVLDIFDFLCFGNRFASGDPYACDCDTSTGSGICDIFDFLCFGNEFNSGCP